MKKIGKGPNYIGAADRNWKLAGDGCLIKVCAEAWMPQERFANLVFGQNEDENDFEEGFEQDD